MSELAEMTDTAQDAVIEAVESEEVGEDHPGWHRRVALTTMIMALLAAFGGLLSGITANEALLERTKEIMEVSYLEGDRVYVETIRAKQEILTALGETPDPVEFEEVLALDREIRQLDVDTVHVEGLTLSFTSAHLVFAIAVTLLSLGITLGGMAVVVERRLLWIAGLVSGAVGATGVGLGVLTMLA